MANRDSGVGRSLKSPPLRARRTTLSPPLASDERGKHSPLFEVAELLDAEREVTGPVRAVIQAVGIPNVLTKSIGTHNPHNVVKATFKALALLREPVSVAKTRSLGLKKVFNG